MSRSIPKPIASRLNEWALAYGGEQYRRLGYSSLERIGDPAANDDVPEAAQQLEAIVRAMEESGRWKEARVLRAEYFMAALPEQVRLARLRRIGLSISRASYYVYLETAHAWLAGALSAALPASASPEAEEALP